MKKNLCICFTNIKYCNSRRTLLGDNTEELWPGMILREAISEKKRRRQFLKRKSEYRKKKNGK
jgi:hypothetical protein